MGRWTAGAAGVPTTWQRSPALMVSSCPGCSPALLAAEPVADTVDPDDARSQDGVPIGCSPRDTSASCGMGVG